MVNFIGTAEEKAFKSKIHCHKASGLMLGIILFLPCFLLIIGVSHSNQSQEELGNYQYRLLMSKEDKVCTHMLALYNADLHRESKVNYPSHPEFTAIKWQDGKYILNNTERGVKFTIGGKFAKFDINNDGKEEVVFKKEVPYRNLSGDELFVFADTTLDFTCWVEFTVHGLGNLKE